MYDTNKKEKAWLIWSLVHMVDFLENNDKVLNGLDRAILSKIKPLFFHYGKVMPI